MQEVVTTACRRGLGGRGALRLSSWNRRSEGWKCLRAGDALDGASDAPSMCAARQNCDTWEGGKERPAWPGGRGPSRWLTGGPLLLCRSHPPRFPDLLPRHAPHGRRDMDERLQPGIEAMALLGTLGKQSSHPAVQPIGVLHTVRREKLPWTCRLPRPRDRDSAQPAP